MIFAGLDFVCSIELMAKPKKKSEFNCKTYFSLDFDQTLIEQ
jgi:hypothetical protein